MLYSRTTSLSLYLPRVLCDCSRNVRMGVTIPVKKVKPLIKPKIKETYSDREFRRIRQCNEGIAHSLMRKIADGYNENVYEDPEDFVGTDLDVSDTGYILKENEKFVEKDFQTKHFHNIKRKHFKEEKLPNMITYIEKCQIKHLHKEDPEHWNLDKLAESFPASPGIIKKILNSQFTAYTVKAVQRHDNTVRRNWDLFRKGELSFDKELEAHYTKFAGRLKLPANENEIKKFLPSPPDFNNQPIREFSEIITSSKKYKALEEKKRKEVEIDESGNVIHTMRNSRVKAIHENRIHCRVDANQVTLDVLREEIGSNSTNPIDAIIMNQAPNKLLPRPSEFEESNNVRKNSDSVNFEVDSTDDQTYKKTCSGTPEFRGSNRLNQKTKVSSREKLKNSEIKNNEIENARDIYKEFDYLNRETGIVGEKLPSNFADLQEDRVLLQIRIPQKVWQKDKLYRIKDCFYDDQGVFLYRVPGLF